MIEFFVVPLFAFLASCLTFFSGFGLGTILLPAFALFFPLEIAVALTAVVHFLNNVFKLFLVGRNADKAVVLRFGLPALAASFLGAFLLLFLSRLPVLFSYSALGVQREVGVLSLVVAVLIVLFAVLEVLPSFGRVNFPKKYLPFGGVLSGFFGGLSGHQGAFRSAFLVRAGLTKEGFIGTGVVIALLVDIARLVVYGVGFSFVSEQLGLLVVAVLSAFLGAYVGNRFLKRVSFEAVRWVVAVMLFFIALGLGLGFL